LYKNTYLCVTGHMIQALINRLAQWYIQRMRIQKGFWVISSITQYAAWSRHK